MAVVILYCRLCDAGYQSVGDLPVRCPTCGLPTRWGTSPPWTVDPPTLMLKLSRDDRRFLRTIGIDPETP